MNSQQDSLKDKFIVGIDLGTTNSGISAWVTEQQQVQILTDYTLIPSVVGWNRSDNTYIVGREALELSKQHPTDVVYSIKRYIGHAFNDANVSADRSTLTYKLIPGTGQDKLNDVVVDFGDRNGVPHQVKAPDISAKVLFQLRQDAASRLGIPIEEIKYAVITVPAYFNVLQREATKLAGRQAGLEVVDILNEPTAAALSYRTTVLEKYEKCRILVYDLGGGTFDISLLEFERDEDGYAFYTLAVDGDTRLGGDDIDRSIASWLAEEIEKRYGTPISPSDQITRNILRQKAEEAKIQLSAKNTFVIDLPSLDLGHPSSTPFNAQIELSREQLEKCAAKIVQRTLDITKRVVEGVAGFTWKDIDEVILVGWQTLMPSLQLQIEELTGRKPHVSDRPQLAVALGAGEYAHILSLGQEKFQANTLINVIALPLGIRLDDDTFEVLVEAHKTLPYTSQVYPVTTTEDNQQSILVEVLQGPKEATKASDCVRLDFVKMNILSPAPKGIPKFEVVLKIESDGTMYVEVKDTSTGKVEKLDLIANTSQKIQI